MNDVVTGCTAGAARDLTEIAKYVIGPADHGRQVLSILKGPLSMSTRTVRRLKREGLILVFKDGLDPRPAMVRDTVAEGETLAAYLPGDAPREAKAAATTAVVGRREGAAPQGFEPLESAMGLADLRVDQQSGQLPEFGVVYEDEHVLVVDKPAGVVVHPVRGHRSGTLVDAVLARWARMGQYFVPRPVNRLDKDTSGLVVFAKTQHAHGFLAAQLEDRRMSREYLAVVRGVLEEDEGTIDAPIGYDPGPPPKRKVMPRGKPAATCWAVVERFAGATLVRLWLKTGRTHQIRVHMSHIGHAVYGDRFYDPEPTDLIDRQALHAIRLAFVHPGTRTEVEFTSPLPEDIRGLLETLRARQEG